jgi:hypothetical protein
MKVKYKVNSTKWEVILFDYTNDVPSLDLEPEVEIYNGNMGVVGIQISRSKNSIQNAASIQIVGELDAAYCIGNWVIIKSKVGKFDNPNDISPLTEGIIRFIGQITTIESRYAKMPSGLLAKQFTIHIREWSSLLNIPIKFDAYSFMEYWLNKPAALARTELFSAALKKEIGDKISSANLIDMASKLVDPFLSVKIILSLVGVLNAKSSNAMNVSIDSEEAKYFNIARLTSRMPFIPQPLLEYLGLKDTKGSEAFSTGFVKILTGVMFDDGGLSEKKKQSQDRYGSKDFLDKQAFSGYFSNFDKLNEMFVDPKDRPISTNFLESLGRGSSIWSLVTEKIDTSVHECFTDIWYFKDGDKITSYPVLVARDKPFILKDFYKEANITSTKWTTYDDVPRVFADDVLIMALSTSNTFFTSANFVFPQIVGADVGYPKQDNPTVLESMVKSRIIDDASINRFGTQQHFWTTQYAFTRFPDPNFVGPLKPDQSNSVMWFDEAKKLIYYWNCLGYRFGQANLTLKDNNLPIMVGCNLSFPFGKNLLCGHVDSVVWSFNIQPDGVASTTTSVALSYLCQVSKEDGSLKTLGPLGFTDLTDPDLADENPSKLFPFIADNAEASYDAKALLQEQKKKRAAMKKRTSSVLVPPDEI